MKPNKSSKALLRPRKRIGRGLFENSVWAVDILIGKRVLRLVEKQYSHGDPKAVWYDMKILKDLQKAGCRIPTTVRVIDGNMPSLLLTDLRFEKGKRKVVDIGVKAEIKNKNETRADILRQVKIAAENGYELREDCFLLSIDKKGNAVAFVCN